ncbi:MAG: glycosyltransferase [Bacteroidales bacterium]|nr:glycosyltransferase [Bacteroidales bacterium]
MQKALVSVIIPCYNVEIYVEEAIYSIMNQTYKDLEIICIDDGSKDRTGEILQKLSHEDSRIIYIQQKKNLKIVETLNRILPLTKGEFIARMDADDICTIDRIEKQVNFMQKHPEIAVVGSWAIKFGKITRKWTPPTSSEDIVEELFLGSPIPHSVVMFRRSILKDIIYDKNYLYVEDYKLWFDLSKKYKLANIPEFLLYYRIHSSQTCFENPVQTMNLKKLKIEIINYYLAKYGTSITIEDFFGIKSLNLLKIAKTKVPRNLYLMMKTSVYLNSRASIFTFLYFFISLDFISLKKRFFVRIISKHLLKK